MRSMLQPPCCCLSHLHAENLNERACPLQCDKYLLRGHHTLGIGMGGPCPEGFPVQCLRALCVISLPLSCALMHGYKIGPVFLAVVGEFFLARGLLHWEYFLIRLVETKADPSKDLKVRTAQHGIWEGFVVAPKWQGKREGKGAKMWPPGVKLLSLAPRTQFGRAWGHRGNDQPKEERRQGCRFGSIQRGQHWVKHLHQERSLRRCQELSNQDK